MLGIEPGVAGSRSKYANHCAMLHPLVSIRMFAEQINLAVNRFQRYRLAPIRLKEKREGIRWLDGGRLSAELREPRQVGREIKTERDFSTPITK